MGRNGVWYNIVSLLLNRNEEEEEDIIFFLFAKRFLEQNLNNSDTLEMIGSFRRAQIETPVYLSLIFFRLVCMDRISCSLYRLGGLHAAVNTQWVTPHRQQTRNRHDDTWE